MSTYKLRISDTVLVRMNGVTTDADGNEQPFKIAVVSKRQSPEQIEAHISARRGLNELMLELTTECREQDVVEGGDGSLAPASMDVLKVILGGVPHIGVVWWDAFQLANGAKAKQGN